MLVKELIVLLSQYDPDDEVLINTEDEDGDEIITGVDSVELDIMPGMLRTSVCIVSANTFVEY